MAFVITPLTPFGSIVSTAEGISENGTIVGSSGSGNYIFASGQYSIPPSDGQLRSILGVNDAQHFVGVTTAGLLSVGYVYDGSFHEYNQPDFVYRFSGNALTDINTADVAVGTASTTNVSRGIIFSNASAKDFTIPDASSTMLYGISDKGYLSGVYTSGNAYHGFIFADGVTTTIDPRSGYIGQVSDVNDSKVAVGSFSDSAGQHGFVWSAGSFMPFDVGGAKSTSLNGINDRGEIVGTYIDQSGNSHAFSGEHLNETFRFYDTVTNDHFYTTSAAEAASIKANLPTFTYEGSPWLTPDKSSQTVDVFRFYDTVTKTHFLTQDASEAATIKTTLPTFTYEGVAFEAYASADAPGTFSLERFYNTNSKVHTYAADANEVALIKSGAVGQGWIDEGKAFVVHVPVADFHI